jgi:formimidoylglutamate deiminase
VAERIAAAAEKTGIGLTLLPVFYAHSNFGGVPPARGQRRFISTVDQFGDLVDKSRQTVAHLPDATIGVAPHSLRAVTPDELDAIIPLANGGPIHIHAAEQTKEVDDCVAWSGARPVEWLLDHTAVGQRWCLVHATHVTETEAARLARSRAVAGLCPITEANLGDGIFPAREYMEGGGRFGVGTDSNVQIDAPGELRAVEYAQRLRTRSRNVLASDPGRSTGRDLFEATLAGGGQALGQQFWGFREGAPADFLTLDATDPAYFGRRDDSLIDSWIFAGGKIDCVWRAGRKLVQHGSHIARAQIAAHYRRAVESVLE